MGTLEEINESVRELSSDNEAVRKRAIQTPLKHSKTQAGLSALNRSIFTGELGRLLGGEEAQAVVICNSRLKHFLATGELGDWDHKSLKAWQRKFDKLKTLAQQDGVLPDSSSFC
jgi:hypothetical protein